MVRVYLEYNFDCDTARAMGVLVPMRHGAHGCKADWAANIPVLGCQHPKAAC